MNRSSVLEDWEGGLTLAIQDVVGAQQIDSQIKEILVTRLVKAARAGSSAMQDSFKDLEESLDDRTEKRALWFNSSELNGKLDNDVLVSLREGLNRVDAQRRKTNEMLNQLAANKLVWVGAMLRNTNGKIEAWLYRDDVPDGAIVCVVPNLKPEKTGRIASAGRISGKQTFLAGDTETALAGRPLYWIRPAKLNNN